MNQQNYFKFANTPNVIFGNGTFNQITKYSHLYGERILLIIGGSSLKKSGKLEELKSNLNNTHEIIQIMNIKSEPSPAIINKIVKEMKKEKINLVIAVGGGSVLDSGKAISAMLCETGNIEDYLDGLGTKKHNGKKIPFIAVPTTSGTGSEATKNAVISEIGHFKKSLRHDNFIPDYAIVDPELTLTCPSLLTLTCGLDALSQLIESYTSTESSEITGSLALGAIKKFGNNLIPACTNKSDDLNTRSSLSYASMISGITLANAGVGIIHGIAGPMGGLYDIPHGAACGNLLPESLKINLTYLKEKKSNEYLLKFSKIGKTLCDTKSDEIEKNCSILISTIENWIKKMDLPRLSHYGIKENKLEEIVRISSNKNNPVSLDKKDIFEIIKNRI